MRYSFLKIFIVLGLSTAIIECKCSPEETNPIPAGSSTPPLATSPPPVPPAPPATFKELDDFVAMAADDNEKKLIKDLFPTDDLKKIMNDLLKNDATLRDVIAAMKSSTTDKCPRRDDNVDFVADSKIIGALCSHGERLILIGGIADHIYIRAFNGTPEAGGIYSLYKQGSTWKSVVSKKMNLDVFKRMNTALVALLSTGTPVDRTVVSNYILEQIDKFEGIVTSGRAAIAGNFAAYLSSRTWKLVDSSGKYLKVKADNSGVEFA